MSFTSELAEIRFGCGLSPVIPAPTSVQAMLDGLMGPDTMTRQFPVETFDTFRDRMIAATELRKRMRKARGTPEFEGLRKERNLMNKDARQDMAAWYGQTLLRWSYTPTGFRERLTAFWADHFTATGKAGVVRRATSPYVEDAIRPHLTGRFADLLVAAVTHPLMLIYLDQIQSMGPASKRALKSNGKFGLNENLAREVLELHTLGVDGTYAQDDVRQLAELFTGMTFQPRVGFKFSRDMAEPGAETVLGNSYGGDPARLEPVLNALRDLAVHPDTARHVAWKLAVHFVADTPDPDLVAALERRFLETDGDLTALYAEMLAHPAAWDTTLHNVKQPFDFVASTCRSLSVDPGVFAGMDEKQFRANLLTPMTLMGQTWQTPAGPDGWPEEDDAWITPQGLSARVRWAMAIPLVLRPDLPDPRRFVTDALGDLAPEPVRFAANAAESRSDAIGLVLSSPAFQRR